MDTYNHKRVKKWPLLRIHIFQVFWSHTMALREEHSKMYVVIHLWSFSLAGDHQWVTWKSETSDSWIKHSTQFKWLIEQIQLKRMIHSRIGHHCFCQYFDSPIVLYIFSLNNGFTSKTWNIAYKLHGLFLLTLDVHQTFFFCVLQKKKEEKKKAMGFERDEGE